MTVDITVPGMGESITEATVGEILTPTGTAVAMDDEILELETDKVNQVLYAPQAGKVSFSVQTGDVVKIGQKIGSIELGAAPEKKVEVVKEVAEEEPPPPPPPPVSAPPQPQPALEEGAGVRQSKEAYLAALDQPEKEPKVAATPPPIPKGDRGVRREKLSKIRKVIAQRLVEVQQETAMLTTFNEVDMSAIIHLRNEHKETFLKKHGVKLGFMSFFVKAVVSALEAYPIVNASIEGDELVYRNYIDIGIAVSTERGLVVPVVRNCDQLSFAAIEQAIANYASKAREGRLAVDDLKGGGFTITNGGVFGSLLSTPILNPTQCAILGMHKIEKRAVVIDDEIVILPMMYLAMSYDHRILDGKEAVTFLVHLKNMLEEPSRLLLEV